MGPCSKRATYLNSMLIGSKTEINVGETDSKSTASETTTGYVPEGRVS